MRLDRQIVFTVAFSCAASGCGAPRPSEADIRACILTKNPHIEKSLSSGGWPADSVSVPTFGKTITSQGGMFELAVGAPAGTTIFPVSVRLVSKKWTGGRSEEAVFWVFKDSFGKLKCEKPPR